MTEGGRPWWNVSAVENARPQLNNARPQLNNARPQLNNARPQLNNGRPQLNRNLFEQNLLKPSTMSPRPFDNPVIKAEPSNHFPNYSAKRIQVDYSVVKSEPLTHIKSEPLAYLERALVKGEFPLDFSWPYMKWEPIPGASGVKVKKEEKNYIPKPNSTDVFSRLDARNNPYRRRNRPPPNWTYIYARQTYQPTASAQTWWNPNVEKALNKRRDAFLLTKQNDNVSIEKRMERLWTFEVAKDEVRRVITESKWRAAASLDGIYKDDDELTGEASSSAERDPKSNGSINGDLSSQLLKGRVGQLATVIENETANKNFDGEIKVVPVEKGIAEVYTIDDEIEDTMSNSDSDNIRVISEGNSEVIFIEKKRGEVNIVAQVQGRVIKMNRKRKLCVTLLNTEKRQHTISTIDIEQSNLSDNDSKDEDISFISEQRKENGVINKMQPIKTCDTIVSRQSDSPEKNAQNVVENENDLIDISDVDGEKDVLGDTDTDVQVSNADVDIQIDSASISDVEEKDKGVEENSVDSISMLDVELVNDKESCCSSINVIEDQTGMTDNSVMDEDDIIVETTEDNSASKTTAEDGSDLNDTLPDDDDVNVIEEIESTLIEETVIEEVEGQNIIEEGEQDVIEDVEQDVIEDVEQDVIEDVEQNVIEEGEQKVIEDVEQNVGDDADQNDVLIVDDSENEVTQGEDDKEEFIKDLSEEVTILESEDTNDDIIETEAEDQCGSVTKKVVLFDMKEDEADLSEEKKNESNAQASSRQPEEDVLVINLQESDVEALSEVDESVRSPQSIKSNVVKYIQKRGNSSRESLLPTGNCDEEIEILEANITTMPREQGKITRLGSKQSGGNAVSNVGTAANANIRQTRQSMIENRNIRNTRSMPEKPFAVTGRQNVMNLKDDDKMESTLPRGNRKALLQTPSSYSFRNRSKRC